MNGAQLVEWKGKWCAQHGKKGMSSPRWGPEDWIADGVGVAETACVFIPLPWTQSLATRGVKLSMILEFWVRGIQAFGLPYRLLHVLLPKLCDALRA